MRSLFRLIQATVSHPLNRGSVRSKTAALGRVLRWQLASRILPEAAVALPFVRGASLVATRGMVGATGNWYGGLDEPGEMGLLLHLLRSGDSFIDIGANIGSFTILAASIDGVSCMAFEPVPRTFALLSRNVAFNQMVDRVELRQQGVSDAPGTLRFTTSLDSMNYVLLDGVPAEQGAIAVDVVRLDDAAVPQPAPAGRRILKIDVEGFEMPVLRGAAETLRDPSALCVIMETNGSGERYGVSDAELIACMADYGFQPFNYSPFTRTFEPAVGQSAGVNTVFVKDLAEALQRVREAPAVSLINGSL